MMEYKGYIGKVGFDAEAAVFHGEVINTRDMITFQGDSVAGLTQAFHDSIDDYLEFCKQRGEAPDKPFSGQFLTRITPELHRQVNAAAAVAGKSLNAWVTEQLREGVQRSGAGKAKRRRTTTGKTGPHRKKLDSHSQLYFPSLGPFLPAETPNTRRVSAKHLSHRYPRNRANRTLKSIDEPRMIIPVVPEHAKECQFEKPKCNCVRLIYDLAPDMNELLPVRILRVDKRISHRRHYLATFRPRLGSR